MDYTGNIQADWLYDLDQSTKEPEQPKQYLCTSCECYFDEHKIEIPKHIAVNNDNVANHVCNSCFEYELINN